tara:strand:- start:9859 stop:10584 length:726 start_codon:yes stop_codon:yes gene_type:complete
MNYLSSTDGASFILSQQNGTVYKGLVVYKRPWSRTQKECYNWETNNQYSSLSQIQQLNMKRKAETLRYVQLGNSETKAQLQSRFSRGINKYNKTTWASQSQGYPNASSYLQTYPNVNKLLTTFQRTGINSSRGQGIRLLTCNPPNSNVVKSYPVSVSNVPPSKTISKLYFDPLIPITNYVPVNRTYKASSEKWPQSCWKKGDLGFPVRKSGGALNSYNSIYNFNPYTEISNNRFYCKNISS